MWRASQLHESSKKQVGPVSVGHFVGSTWHVLDDETAIIIARDARTESEFWALIGVNINTSSICALVLCQAHCRFSQADQDEP